MSQLRKDILTGEWVIFASNRREKPYQFKRKTISNESALEENCPFCPGNETQTPEKIYQNGDDGSWDIRVFRNMYPAVDTESFEQCYENFYPSQAGIGIHEVVVDTPDHSFDLCGFSKEHMLKVLKTLQFRFNKLKEEDFINYIQIFKNNGPEAGASIAHSHWQIMGVSVVPQVQEKVFLKLENYEKKHGKCIICEILKHEKTEEKRIIYETNEFVAFVPYAAKFSFEIWVVPKNHISSYSDFDEKLLDDLGETLKVLLNKVKKIRKGICFNLCFQDEPKNTSKGIFHWHLRILPRIGAPAGFEFATGSYINPMLPEEAAEKLREL